MICGVPQLICGAPKVICGVPKVICGVPQLICGTPQIIRWSPPMTRRRGYLAFIARLTANFLISLNKYSLFNLKKFQLWLITRLLNRILMEF